MTGQRKPQYPGKTILSLVIFSLAPAGIQTSAVLRDNKQFMAIIIIIIIKIIIIIILIIMKIIIIMIIMILIIILIIIIIIKVIMIKQ